MKTFIKKAKILGLTIGLIFTMSFSLTVPSVGYYGEFRMKKILTYYDSVNNFTSYMAYANLYSDSVNSMQTWKASNLGQVSYNNIPLNYNSYINLYMDTVQRKSNSGITWSLKNSSIYDGFTTSCVDSFPSFGNINVLPDSLIKSQDFNINLGSFFYADEIEVTMYDGQFRTSVPFYRRVRSDVSSIVIPSRDLSSLMGNSINVTVSLIKNEFKVINGKTFKFEKSFNFVRLLPLLN